MRVTAVRTLAAFLFLCSLVPSRAHASVAPPICVQVPDGYTVETPSARWTPLPAAQLEPGKEFHPSGPADLSCGVTLAWNSSYLFVIARVVDDHFNPADSMSGFWNGDSIQFAFSPVGSGGSDGRYRLSLGAADFPFGRKVVVTDGPPGLPPGVLEIPFKVLREGQVLTYVVAVPWRYAPGIDPLSDEGFRFNLIVNDNDGSGRRGWLQLSDGIGDGLDVSKFGIAPIARSPEAGPQIHLAVPEFRVDAAKTTDLSVTVRDASQGMTVRVSAGKWAAERKVTGKQGTERLVFSEKPEAFEIVGDVPIHAELLDSSGRAVVRAETSVLVEDSSAASRTIEQARAGLAEVDALVARTVSGGGNADYVRLRANCLRYALRVDDLIRPRLSSADESARILEGVHKNMVKYAGAAVGRLLTDARALTANPLALRPAMRRPNLHAPWTIRDGDIYAGPEPVMLTGVCWTYGNKDSSFRMGDLGMNAQSVDMGPNSILGDGFAIKKDLVSTDPVPFWRRVVGEGQGWGEVFDLHTSPHYTPSWFKVDDHYAWLSTPDGRRLLELTYRGLAEALGGMKAIKTADLANELTYWSTSQEAMNGFREWLRKGYGSIGKLNRNWGTALQSFDQVPNPFPSADGDAPSARKGVYQPMNPEGIYRQRGPYWDWCRYNTTQTASAVAWMHGTLKKSFPSLLTHVKCILSSREYRTLADNFVLGIDPEKTLAVTDLIGTDASYVRGSAWKGTLFSYDYLRSICPGKPIVCMEMHAPPYSDAEAPGEIRRGLFQRFVHGERYNLVFLMVTSGVMDWWAQGFESTNMNSWNIGACPAVLESIGTTSADLQRLAKEVSSFAKRKPDALIYYDNAADFGVPGSDAPQGRYGDRAMQVYQSLIGRDVRVGFVTESMLSHGIPSAPLIILAGAQYVSDRSVKALATYVSKGGVLVWLGDNLQYDHYGMPRSLGAWTRSDRVVRMPLPPDASEWGRAWPKLFSSAGIRPPFAVRGAGGGPIQGVEIKSVRMADGRRLVFLANAGAAPASFRLVGETKPGTHCRDLISGGTVDLNSVEMSPNQAMILSVESGRPASK